MPFLIEVQCRCNRTREIWLRSRRSKPNLTEAKCPVCGSEEFTRLLGGNFGSYESSDAETRKSILQKRSLDHTKRTAKENVDRIIAKSHRR